MDDAFSSPFATMIAKRAEGLCAQLTEICGALDEVQENLRGVRTSIRQSRGAIESIDAHTPELRYCLNAPLVDTSIAYSPFAQ